MDEPTIDKKSLELRLATYYSDGDMYKKSLENPGVQQMLNDLHNYQEEAHTLREQVQDLQGHLDYAHTRQNELKNELDQERERGEQFIRRTALDLMLKMRAMSERIDMRACVKQYEHYIRTGEMKRSWEFDSAEE